MILFDCGKVSFVSFFRSDKYGHQLGDKVWGGICSLLAFTDSSVVSKSGVFYILYRRTGLAKEYYAGDSLISSHLARTNGIHVVGEEKHLKPETTLPNRPLTFAN